MTLINSRRDGSFAVLVCTFGVLIAVVNGDGDVRPLAVYRDGVRRVSAARRTGPRARLRLAQRPGDDPALGMRFLELQVEAQCVVEARHDVCRGSTEDGAQPLY